MTIRDLPAQGSTSWYPWAQDVQREIEAISTLSAATFGAVPGGTSTSQRTATTTALNAWLAAVAATGKRGYLPGNGTPYYINGPLVCAPPGGASKFGVRIEGDGIDRTLIDCSLVGATILTVGPGDPPGSISSGGSVRGIRLLGATANPTGSDFSTALLVKGLRQFRVENVDVARARIGYDLQQNCYGTSFINCTVDGDTVAMPVYLRGHNDSTGAGGAGNDINFYDCRFKGRDGAVAMGPDGGGYRFFGGLYGGGAATHDAPMDSTKGAINTAYEYQTGATVNGATSVLCVGVSFEQTESMYMVRAANDVTLIAPNFIANTGVGAIAPIGVVSINSSPINVIGATVDGRFTSAQAVDLVSAGDGFTFHETGTRQRGSATFNGVTPSFGQNMLDLSPDARAKGISMGRNVQTLHEVLRLGTTVIRSDGKISVDGGAFTSIIGSGGGSGADLSDYLTKAAALGGYGPAAAPMRAYFAPRRPASLSDAGRTTPIVAKVKNGAAVITQSASGLPSIYWGILIRVPDSVYAAYPTLGRWRVYFTTDHDTGAGAVGMIYTTAEYPDDPAATWTPWRHPTTGSAILFTEGGTTQTETFTVVWNPVTQVFHHYWQIQRQVPGVGLVQVTRVGTSVDGVNVSIIGDALPTPTATLAGYDHTGYAKVWLVDGLWVCWSNLGSGTEVSSGALWYSYDGFTFVRDPRRMRGNLHWTEGTLRTAIGGLFTFRGGLWASGTSTTFTSGITTSDTSQPWMAPMNPDLRSLRGRPQYLDFPAVAASGETGVTSPPHAWAAAPDGRLFGAYRSGGASGQLALAVMS